MSAPLDYMKTPQRPGESYNRQQPIAQTPNYSQQVSQKQFRSSVGITQSAISTQSGNNNDFDLEEIIGSLGIDLATPSRSAIKSGPHASNQPGQFSMNQLKSNKQDITCIRYGSKITFRGSLGRYITAVPRNQILDTTTTSISSSSASAVAVSTSTVYTLGVNGQGVGDLLDCMVLRPLDNPSDNSDEVITYGTTLCVRSPGAHDRLLGLRDNTKLGFWRPLIGQGEKWTILKAQHLATRNSTMEDVSARGQIMKLGDSILFQSGPLLTRDQLHGALRMTETVLVMHEGVDGCEPRMIGKDRRMLGGEAWVVESYLSPPLPPWLTQRPYLSGRFVLTPSTQRHVPATEALLFPHSVATINKPTNGNAQQNDINSNTMMDMTEDQQANSLLWDTLSVMSGVEGRYIRVTAAQKIKTSAGHGGGSGSGGASGDGAPSRLCDIKLVVEAEGVDPSLADQISLLLPICEQAFAVKEFIRKRSFYDYGLCAHALAAELRNQIKEFEILVIQLEGQMLNNTLTPQRLLFLCQPISVTLKVLSELCKRLEYSKGGSLLTELHQQAQHQGDTALRKIITDACAKASEPFLAILEQWLYKGQLNDIYGEFMIQENETITKEALSVDFNAQYWETKYSLNPRNIPPFLASVASKVLVAGKYLTVVRGISGVTLQELKKGGERFQLGVKDISRHVPDENDSGDDDDPLRHSGYHQNEIIHNSQNDNVNYSTAPSNSHTHMEAPTQPFTSSTKESLTKSSHEHPQLKYSPSDPDSLSRALENCHRANSRALLQLLEGRYHLSSHLRSLRRFFLLEHGDFFLQLMDAAKEELSKDVNEIRLSLVQALLQSSIQSSTLSSDPHREDLSCTLEPHNLIQHLHLIQVAGNISATQLPKRPTTGLKGVEALVLNYKVSWPLSIVLSRKAVTKYQLLSRILFFSKHVEMRILGAWQDHQRSKELSDKSARMLLGPYFGLRQRMLHFLQNFTYYMTAEVIQPRDHELMTDLADAVDMDQLLALHERFLDQCLAECLLASHEVLNVLTKIMATCLLFADHVNRLSEALDRTAGAIYSSPVLTQNSRNVGRAGRRSSGPRLSAGSNTSGKSMPTDREVDEQERDAEMQRKAHRTNEDCNRRKDRQKKMSEHVHNEARHESFSRYFALFEGQFDKEVSEFLEKLWADSHRSHPQLAHLCARLDFNGFYSQKFVSDVTL